MPRQPMSEEAKKAMLERLKAGRAKTKAMRDEAKAKGLPDPKPRRSRKKATHDGAIQNPLAHPERNDKIPGIQSAPEHNKAADTPITAQPVETKPIDVPNMPEDKKEIVQDATKKPKARAKKAATNSAGVPANIQQNQMLTTQETGDMVIPVQYPDQKKSIEKALKKNKELNPETPARASQASKTVERQVTHTPDKKAIEATPSVPFSFSAVRKALYQY
jgi:hypothetical protein